MVGNAHPTVRSNRCAPYRSPSPIHPLPLTHPPIHPPTPLLPYENRHRCTADQNRPA